MNPNKQSPERLELLLNQYKVRCACLTERNIELERLTNIVTEVEFRKVSKPCKVKLFEQVSARVEANSRQVVKGIVIHEEVEFIYLFVLYNESTLFKGRLVKVTKDCLYKTLKQKLYNNFFV